MLQHESDVVTIPLLNEFFKEDGDFKVCWSYILNPCLHFFHSALYNFLTFILFMLTSVVNFT